MGPLTENFSVISVGEVLSCGAGGEKEGCVSCARIL